MFLEAKFHFIIRQLDIKAFLNKVKKTFMHSSYSIKLGPDLFTFSDSISNQCSLKLNFLTPRSL